MQLTLGGGPGVYPKPILTPLSLSMPVALPDASSGDLEDASAQAALSVSLAGAAAASGSQDDNEMSAAHDLLRSAQVRQVSPTNCLLLLPTVSYQLLHTNCLIHVPSVSYQLSPTTTHCLLPICSHPLSPTYSRSHHLLSQNLSLSLTQPLTPTPTTHSYSRPPPPSPIQAAADKAVLRLFHAACRSDRPARAADLAAALQLPASMHGALKLANALHQVGSQGYGPLTRQCIWDMVTWLNNRSVRDRGIWSPGQTTYSYLR